MSKYLKTSFNIVYSDNADYSEPEYNPPQFDMELTPDEAAVIDLLVTVTASEPIEVPFTTVSFFMVVNRDDTNALTLTYDSSTTVGAIVSIPAGGVFITQDVDVSSNMPELDGAVATEQRVKVIVAGT
jgi:hypothetical protein